MKLNEIFDGITLLMNRFIQLSSQVGTIKRYLRGDKDAITEGGDNVTPTEQPQEDTDNDKGTD